MVVAAGLDLDLDLDPPEERRVRVEDEPVRPRAATSARSRMRPSSSVSPGRRARRRGRARRARRRPGRRGRCRGRASRSHRPRIYKSLPRRLAVLAGDLVLVGADEVPVADDFLAARRRAGRPGAAPRGRGRRRDRSPRRRARGRPCARPRCPRACPARAARCRRGRARLRRRACRAGAPRARSSPRGPPRPRATSSACLTSKKRSLRSFEAEPSTPSPTGAPASTSSRTGATPAPSRRFEVGQCATPTPARPNAATSAAERWTQCAHQTSPATQPSSSRYSTGRQPYSSRQYSSSSTVSARCVCSRSPSLPRELRRLRHQLLRDRERRAGRDRELHHPVLVLEPGEPLGVGEDLVDRLDERVRRQPAVRLAEVHRPARGDDPHAELAAPPAPRPPRARSGRAGRRSGGRRPSCSPTARARRGPVRAAAYSDSASIRAHTGYSSRSHSNSVASCARARVSVWYRWWWVLTSPGVTTAPPRSTTSSAAGGAPPPTASTSPSRTSTQPLSVLGAGIVHRADPAVLQEHRHRARDHTPTAPCRSRSQAFYSRASGVPRHWGGVL